MLNSIIDSKTFNILKLTVEINLSVSCFHTISSTLLVRRGAIWHFIILLHDILDQFSHHFALPIQLVDFIEILFNYIKLLLEFGQCPHVLLQFIGKLLRILFEQVHQSVALDGHAFHLRGLLVYQCGELGEELVRLRLELVGSELDEVISLARFDDRDWRLCLVQVSHHLLL